MDQRETEALLKQLVLLQNTPIEDYLQQLKDKSLNELAVQQHDVNTRWLQGRVQAYDGLLSDIRNAKATLSKMSQPKRNGRDLF